MENREHQKELLFLFRHLLDINFDGTLYPEKSSPHAQFQPSSVDCGLNLPCLLRPQIQSRMCTSHNQTRHLGLHYHDSFPDLEAYNDATHTRHGASPCTIKDAYMLQVSTTSFVWSKISIGVNLLHFRGFCFASTKCFMAMTI